MNGREETTGSREMVTNLRQDVEMEVRSLSSSFKKTVLSSAVPRKQTVLKPLHFCIVRTGEFQQWLTLQPR